MTRETAEAVGIILDRLTRPIVTLMFSAAICWMGVRTIVNISADQFVAVVMAVVLFWFGSSRPTTASTPPANGPTPAPAALTTPEAKP